MFSFRKSLRIAGFGLIFYAVIWTLLHSSKHKPRTTNKVQIFNEDGKDSYKKANKWIILGFQI